jgi:hypothetical protein
MKPQLAVIPISALLLCLAGCGRPIEEGRLLGTWEFDVQQTRMVLDANHAYTLKADDGRTTLGQWRLVGSRLITIGQTWTNQSGAMQVSVTNDTKITELSDTRMVLQNWGGPIATLTRVVSSH